ncbi:MAG: hypothetical protein ACFFE4_00545 [Candidatus Thorarchaeota archaeon]
MKVKELIELLNTNAVYDSEIELENTDKEIVGVKVELRDDGTPFTKLLTV